MEKEHLENRLKELYTRSENRGIYTYSSFLHRNEAAAALAAAGLKRPEQERSGITLWGGFPEAERVMVRFEKKRRSGMPNHILW